MSLFGLFATALTCGTLLSSSIKDYLYETDSKNIAIQQQKITYADGKGGEKLTSNNKAVYTLNGVIYDKKNCTPILDTNKIKFDKEIEQARVEKKKYIVTTYPGINDCIYHIEVGTKKRYYLRCYISENEKYSFFEKIYYANNQKYSNQIDKKHLNVVQLTKTEFDELDGNSAFLSKNKIYTYF